MVRIGPPPSVLSSESATKSHNSSILSMPMTQMHNSLRRRWAKVAPNTENGIRPPLQEKTFHMVPNVHQSTDLANRGFHANDNKIHEIGLEYLQEPVEYTARDHGRSKGAQPSLVSQKPRKSDTSQVSAEVTQAYAFGRHSAARKHLRCRASLSDMPRSSQAHIAPSKPISIPELRKKSGLETTTSNPNQGLSSNQDQTMATKRPEIERPRFSRPSSSSFGQVLGRIMIDKCTQTDHMDSVKPGVTRPSEESQPDTEAPNEVPDNQSDDLVQISSLDLGIFESSIFGEKLFRSCYKSDIASEHFNSYDVDDLRRVISTEVAMHWKDTEPPHIQELRRIHERFIAIVQEITSAKLKFLLQELGAEEDWRGPHEVSFPESELCNRLSSELYGISVCSDFKIQPAGLLQLYLATIDYLHRGRKPKIGTDAVFLAVAFADSTSLRCVGDFAAISLPDTIFLKISVSELHEGDVAQFFPLYIAPNPFQSLGGKVEVEYTTDVSWISWCNESASFKGTIPVNPLSCSENLNLSRSISHRVKTFPLEITVKAFVRFYPTFESHGVIPHLEKQITTKTRFDVYWKEVATGAAQMTRESLSSTQIPATTPTVPQIYSPVVKLVAPVEFQTLLSDKAMLKRAQRCVSMSMKLFRLARNYSEAAIDCAEIWQASSSPNVHSLSNEDVSCGVESSNSSKTAQTEAKTNCSSAISISSQVGLDIYDIERNLRYVPSPSRSLTRMQDQLAQKLSLSCPTSITMQAERESFEGCSAQTTLLRPGSGSERLAQYTLHDVDKRLDTGTGGLPTPPLSPKGPPVTSQAEDRRYFHPLSDLDWAIVDRVEHPQRPYDRASETEIKSCGENDSSIHQIPAAMRQKDRTSVSQRSHKKKKKKPRTAKGRDLQKQVAFRSKSRQPSHLSEKVSSALDLNDHMDHVRTQGLMRVDAPSPDIGPSECRPKTTFSRPLGSDVKLSIEEARQLEEALQASLKEQAVREAEKAKTLENWDDLFEAASEAEESQE